MPAPVFSRLRTAVAPVLNIKLPTTLKFPAPAKDVVLVPLLVPPIVTSPLKFRVIFELLLTNALSAEERAVM